MKNFTATSESDGNIITVMANNESDAVNIIRKEMNKNSSRRPYLIAWEKDGCKIVSSDPKPVSMIGYSGIGNY